MDRTLKGTVAVIVSALVVAIAVYGSYLPMRKAQTYIATLQSFQAQPPTSLEDLESRLAPPLDYTSPIGQEELVRNTANSTLSLLQRGLDATSTAQLVNFLNSYYSPILIGGKGMSFGQDAYLEGAIGEVAFSQTGNPVYLSSAQHAYELAVKLGPNRPQALYGLFDIYRAQGNVTGTLDIANRIVNNWPADRTRIEQSLAQFMSSVNAAATSAKTKSTTK